jgi:hypothetical protein
MVPKTLATAIKRWPTTDLAELFGLIHSEIHRRADEASKASKKRPAKKLPGKAA